MLEEIKFQFIRGLTYFRAWLTVFSVSTGVGRVGEQMVAMHQERRRAELSQGILDAARRKVTSHNFPGFSRHC